MYCPSCGTALTQELSYCQRCGANLSISKATVESKSTGKLLETIVQISVLLPGVMLGGMVLLRFNQFGRWFILLFLLMVFLLLLGLDSVLVWQLLRETRRTNKAAAPPELERLDTKELEARQGQVLLAPGMSVTENTTRLFEPAFEEQRAKVITNTID